jgi:chromate reductase, NAD(P)H dehydrogenase (quinone)
MNTDTIRVLGIAGSLRRGSYNRALVRAAVDLAPEGMTIEPFELHDVPFFDADVEKQGDPDAVTVLKEAVRTADALLIATPEYQHSVPGVLKNALDWASRPPKDPPLARKPVAVMGATTGLFGTARAQADLRKVLSYNDALVLQRPEVMVPKAAQAFDDDLNLVDEDARGFLRQLLANLAAWARQVHDWRPPGAS